MHARPSLAQPQGVRTWILVAIVIAVLGVMAAVWDSRDLGDGLVSGSGGSVSAVWDTAQGEVNDLLSWSGNPSTRTAQSGR